MANKIIQLGESPSGEIRWFTLSCSTATRSECSCHVGNSVFNGVICRTNTRNLEISQWLFLGNAVQLDLNTGLGNILHSDLF